MTSALKLERLATRRRKRLEAAEEAYRELLDAVLEAVDEEGANVRDLAKRAGIARATVYNELERRAKAAEHADAIEGNGHPPAPAPADAPRYRGTLEDELVLRALETLADARGHGDHLDRGERVEDVRELLNAYRPRRPIGLQRVRLILDKLTRVVGPRPVVAVTARRGRTNYRLHPAELGHHQPLPNNNAGAAGHPPAPAPADTDVELSPTQAAAIKVLAAGRSVWAADDRGVPRQTAARTTKALRDKGLVTKGLTVELTDLGRRVAEDLENTTNAGAAGS